MKLFPKDRVVGIFRGFSEGGLEFHADLVLPYRNEFQSTPMHGQFLIVQLETEDEAVLGRISAISAQGRLASGAGEDYGLRAIAEDRPIPEDLREQYLKYRIDIRVLGVIRIVSGKVVFAPSHRRLPHVGSKVAFLSDALLCEVAGHNLEGAELGFFALGEFIYGNGDKRLNQEPWMQLRNPTVISKFEVKHLVARRSFVFARAGFGKSNLVKLLFSNLYRTNPVVEKRGNKFVPVGTIIFDPDGEYFWPDDKNRPGLCDVPELENKIVVFTRKVGPSPFYQSFVGGDIKLDIRRLRPSDVISIALSPDKQEQQNVRKLKSLNDSDWRKLVDEIYKNRNAADEDLIKTVLKLTDSQEAELIAARSNMTVIVNMLHDPSSQMMDMLLQSLKEGKICIVDISQLRGTPALILSGLILQKIFDHNQEEFTKADSRAIPTIAVIEEAQSVLGNTGSSGEGPYVSWVKEGRKYDLGAVLITQQPGSIPNELLSQGDNWFIFHLLSAGDLQSVKRANAHFSDDLLSALLNEPIPGHGVYWSSASGKSYPLPIRAVSFEAMVKVQDPNYNRTAANTFARELKSRFDKALSQSREVLADSNQELDDSFQTDESGNIEIDQTEDVLEMYITAAITRFAADTNLCDRIRNDGMPWAGVTAAIEGFLPDILEDRNDIAYKNVVRTMDEVFGRGRWEKDRRPKKNDPSRTVLWLVIKKTIVPEQGQLDL